ncbi:MAG: outer membrane lipoprotein-sorting protein, partial [Gloeobacteraceae cyanobacterium ES-bin-144]|nr:outer membrane lipoprotein-sorting protein [Verrucomicrobiales bacterium]
NIQDNSSIVRLKMEVRQPTAGGKMVLQLQVKSLRSKGSTDLVYQILWPKERKGESFLLRKSGSRAPTGSLFTLPDSLVPLPAAKMKDGIFGSDLSYDDLLENFFAWENQSITGTETVDRVPCQILESKAGSNDHSTYSKVRSWIDIKRMIALRVEKYSSSGKLAKRIDTTRVAKDDTGKSVAASFTLQRPGQDSVTEIEGSNIKHDVTLTAADFTPESLKLLK